MTATLLVAPEELAGEAVEVAGDAYRHLFRARRLAVGERLRVVDGAGAARWARVEAVDRRRGRLALGEPAPDLEPRREVSLFVAPPRPERAAWLVEKATELGVAAIRFVAWERAARDLGAGQLGRLERVARAAVEQCGRARLPRIDGPYPPEEVPRLVAGAACLVLDPAAGEALPVGDGGPIALLVGPEGGWGEGEVASLAAAGARPVGLGTRLLRIETAALAGAAILLAGRSAGPAGV